MQTTDRTEILSGLVNLNAENFETTALTLFQYQAQRNATYRQFLNLLGRNPLDVNQLDQIPFLPIRFFKSHLIQTGAWIPEDVFTSSSTTGQIPSQHLVRERSVYLENTRRGFAQFYGDPAEYCWLALLPSYLERSGSSLVAMADYFIRLSQYPESGFFLHDFEALAARIRACQARKIPTILLGVSFALLDFAELYPIGLQGISIMETGGMKGRRRELTRDELHETLTKAFHIPRIDSEYGMTELLSQAYLRAGDRFEPATTMRVLAMEVNDPFCPVALGRPGVLNIIDLANADTCSFIATEDLGRVYADYSFDVIGRLDAAELRGCNLMRF